eukprot:GHVP01024297.1.p1 GENE.GHVP01024297.1~~GHVP01024297.1.p1  ORF type:complete len:143 (+),score=26.18 GHVP01024297.1:139-567(+)
MLAIREVREDGLADVHFFKNSLVESIEVVAPAMQKEKHSELPAADVEVMRKRDLKSIDEFKKAHSKLGVGVTKEAQDLFNFLSKTHPECVWDQSSINVLGVAIEKPYGIDNISGGDVKAQNRIREVLKNYYEKEKTKDKSKI